MSPFIIGLITPSEAFWTKYSRIVDIVVWAVVGTSIDSDMVVYTPGKFLTAIIIFLGYSINVYVKVQILNTTNLTQSSHTKYYEIMNQLAAYMKKKQFPMHLQRRLKFFYKKKFRGSYFKEDEILGILSGEWRLISLRWGGLIRL